MRSMSKYMYLHSSIWMDSQMFYLLITICPRHFNTIYVRLPDLFIDFFLMNLHQLMHDLIIWFYGS